MLKREDVEAIREAMKIILESEREHRLRDHFAGLAMQGLIAGYAATPEGITRKDFEQIPIDAYGIADDMLKAREQ